MAGITIPYANELERTTALRIKFAALDYRGDIRGDGNTEYIDFFSALPGGWQAEQIGLIETRTEATRLAWRISDGQYDIVAVEHETGIEFLLDGVANDLAVAAIMQLVAWGWKRWNKLRAGDPYKQPSSFVLEVPRDSADGGPSRAPMKLIIPQPVTEEDMSRYARFIVAVGRAG